MSEPSTQNPQLIPNNVPRGTIDALKKYEALLRDWQGRMNLVSKNSLDHAWERHFEDSLQLLPLLPETTKTLFDLGSGAGFPGLVIGICRADLNVHLIESTQKKCRFLEAVAAETEAQNVSVHNIRIEDISREKISGALKSEIPDVITARALSALDTIFAYCEFWAKQNPDLVMVFSKGRKAAEEIKTARTRWNFDVRMQASDTDSEASILIIRNLKKCA